MRKRRDVKDMKGALQEFLEQEGLPELGDLLRVKEAWADLVGEKTAGRSKPYRWKRGGYM